MPLIKQNSNSLQQIILDIDHYKSLTKLNCKFNKLTKLSLCFKDFQSVRKNEDDWAAFVHLLNQSPQLTSLVVRNLSVAEAAFARHPDIQSNKVETLDLEIRYARNTASCLKIIRKCASSLNI